MAAVRDPGRHTHTHTHTHSHTAHPRAPGLAPLSAVGLLSSSREGLAWHLPHHLECVEKRTSPHRPSTLPREEAGVWRSSGHVHDTSTTRPRHVHDTWPQVAGKEVVVLGRSNIVGERAHTAASRRRAQRDLCPRPRRHACRPPAPVDGRHRHRLPLAHRRPACAGGEAPRPQSLGPPRPPDPKLHSCYSPALPRCVARALFSPRASPATRPPAGAWAHSRPSRPEASGRPEASTRPEASGQRDRNTWALLMTAKPRPSRPEASPLPTRSLAPERPQSLAAALFRRRCGAQTSSSPPSDALSSSRQSHLSPDLPLSPHISPYLPISRR